MDLISTTVSPVLESTTCSIIKGSVIQYFEVSQVVDDDYWLICWPEESPVSSVEDEVVFVISADG